MTMLLMIDKELLSDMYEAAPELWHGIAFLFLFLVLALVFLMFFALRLRQKNYFLRRDRERYAETLYASHDGYFAFIYPDEKVNDPRKEISERCSRRLAVILGLEKGIKSNFNDILKCFYKEDIKKISKYVGLLKEEGTAFEDFILLKNINKYIRLEGVRINGADGNIYCDMIWFRDISDTTNRIKTLEKETTTAKQKFVLLQDLLNHLPFPVWLRNHHLDIVYCNKKFADFLEKKPEEIETSHIELLGTNGESVSRSLAEKAHTINRPAHHTTSLVVNENRLTFNAFETPFYAEQTLEKTYSCGCLVDISELDELKRNLKRYQTAQLEILSGLGTAFAVFNQNMTLDFYNQAFIKLWDIEPQKANESLSYSSFLDSLREKRLLPEVPDYKAFKKEELKQFSKIIDPVSDLLHLPNEKTLRRIRASYPMGGLVFAFEDISDRLAATTAYNALISTQNDILNNLFDAVLIFGTNGRLSFFNEVYVSLWQADKAFLSNEPSFDQVLDSQRSFFEQEKDWDNLKKSIRSLLLNMTSKTMTLRRDDNKTLSLHVATLSDGSLMICYQNFEKSSH